HVEAGGRDHAARRHRAARRPLRARRLLSKSLQTDAGWLDRQYATGENLRARIELHRRFSTNPQPWQRWVFDRLVVHDDARVLEVGCGVGELWRENAERIPAGWHVTLTDRKSTRLNSSHDQISYAVFCLKKKTMCKKNRLKPRCRA